MNRLSQDEKKNIKRFHRFIDGIGYKVNIALLVQFYQKTKESKQIKNKRMYCMSYICFHCCLNKSKTKIIKTKSSNPKSNRHMCMHACFECSNRFLAKTQISTHCDCNNSNTHPNLKKETDHPFIDSCALVFDPMDKNCSTINKWLDNMEQRKWGYIKEEQVSSDDEDSESDSEQDEDIPPKRPTPPPTTTTTTTVNYKKRGRNRNRNVSSYIPNPNQVQVSSLNDNTQTQIINLNNISHNNLTDNRYFTQKELLLKTKLVHINACKQSLISLHNIYNNRITSLMNQKCILENQIRDYHNQITSEIDKKLMQMDANIDKYKNELNIQKIKKNQQIIQENKLKNEWQKFGIEPFKLTIDHSFNSRKIHIKPDYNFIRHQKNNNNKPLKPKKKQKQKQKRKRRARSKTKNKKNKKSQNKSDIVDLAYTFKDIDDNDDDNDSDDIIILNNSDDNVEPQLSLPNLNGPYVSSPSPRSYQTTLKQKQKKQFQSKSKKVSLTKKKKNKKRINMIINGSPLHQSEYIHKCKKCDAGFSALRELIKHRSIHDTDRPFACNSCKKRFNDRAKLLSHQQNCLKF